MILPLYIQEDSQWYASDKRAGENSLRDCDSLHQHYDGHSPLCEVYLIYTMFWDIFQLPTHYAGKRKSV